MPEQIIKIGDLVRLRSGGPTMTIAALPKPHLDDLCTAIWFAGNEVHSARFKVECLVSVPFENSEQNQAPQSSW